MSEYFPAGFNLFIWWTVKIILRQAIHQHIEQFVATGRLRFKEKKRVAFKDTATSNNWLWAPKNSITLIISGSWQPDVQCRRAKMNTKENKDKVTLTKIILKEEKKHVVINVFLRWLSDCCKTRTSEACIGIQYSWTRWSLKLIG